MERDTLLSMSAIGIVGGVGPSAGTDLANKIFKHTRATKDQEHIDLFLTSCPSIIPDRTDYLFNGGENPSKGIEKCISLLSLCGATAVGISCNTAHSPKILSRIKMPENVVFVNMIDRCCKEISKRVQSEKGRTRIGLLGTLGTIKTGIYNQYFDNYSFLELVLPSDETILQVHNVIYNTEYGIKALCRVSPKAESVVLSAIKDLKQMGCKEVILGCTELPLVFPEQNEIFGVKLVDPTDVLACALIKETAPEKLI